MNRKIRPIAVLVGTALVSMSVSACTWFPNRPGGTPRPQAVWPSPTAMLPVAPSPTVGPAAMGDERFRVAQHVADRVAGLPGVRQANVLVTPDFRAYVAVVVDSTPSSPSDRIEQRVADRVKAADPRIRDVFVSSNPEFVDRVNRYVEEARAGRPVAGFVEQLNEIVIRLFPNTVQPSPSPSPTRR